MIKNIRWGEVTLIAFVTNIIMLERFMTSYGKRMDHIYYFHMALSK